MHDCKCLDVTLAHGAIQVHLGCTFAADTQVSTGQDTQLKPASQADLA